MLCTAQVCIITWVIIQDTVTGGMLKRPLAGMGHWGNGTGALQRQTRLGYWEKGTTGGRYLIWIGRIEPGLPEKSDRGP
jgi:hypothetical protein